MKRIVLVLSLICTLTLSTIGAPLIENGKFTGAPDFSAITNKSTVRSDLGLAIGTNVQGYDADLTTLGAGGAGARTFLGLAIGTDVQAYNAQLNNIAANSALQLARTTWAITGITANAGSACSGSTRTSGFTRLTCSRTSLTMRSGFMSGTRRHDRIAVASGGTTVLTPGP